MSSGGNLPPGKGPGGPGGLSEEAVFQMAANSAMGFFALLYPESVKLDPKPFQVAAIQAARDIPAMRQVVQQGHPAAREKSPHLLVEFLRRSSVIGGKDERVLQIGAHLDPKAADGLNEVITIASLYGFAMSVEVRALFYYLGYSLTWKTGTFTAKGEN